MPRAVRHIPVVEREKASTSPHASDFSRPKKRACPGLASAGGTTARTSSDPVSTSRTPPMPAAWSAAARTAVRDRAANRTTTSQAVCSALGRVRTDATVASWSVPKCPERVAVQAAHAGGGRRGAGPARHHRQGRLEAHLQRSLDVGDVGDRGDAARPGVRRTPTAGAARQRRGSDGGEDRQRRANGSGHPPMVGDGTDFGNAEAVGYPRPVVHSGGRRAPVAQRIEHLTTDQKVWGSNPYGRADRDPQDSPADLRVFLSGAGAVVGRGPGPDDPGCGARCRRPCLSSVPGEPCGARG